MTQRKSTTSPSTLSMYGLNPFSAQHAASNVGRSHTPSIFGALPYPGATAAIDPPLHSRVTFLFTLSPTILDCNVVGPSRETYYRFVTDPSGQGSRFTLLKAAAGNNIALVEWRTHPTIEVQGVTAKQPVGQWLLLSTDRRSRTMTHNGVQYSWAPFDRFLHLFAPGSLEWLARITKTSDAVMLELTPRAVERDLIIPAILATALLQCGRNID